MILSHDMLKIFIIKGNFRYFLSYPFPLQVVFESHRKRLFLFLYDKQNVKYYILQSSIFGVLGFFLFHWGNSRIVKSFHFYALMDNLELYNG